jgi:glutaredoxin 3
MTTTTLYTRHLCWWCEEAKRVLRERGIPFNEVDIGRDKAAFEEMTRLSGQRYVPTLVMDGRVLADFDANQLNEFLKKS